MKKNWLIRTKNNHILGPVSKDKIKELLKNGSIKGDDEISCANGYWLYVREEDLLEKYVFGEEKQFFNPVQEAQPTPISDFPPNLDLLKVQPESENEHNQVNNTLIQQNPLMAEQETQAEERELESQQDENQQESPNTPSENSEKKNNKRVIKRRNLKAVSKQKEKSKSHLTKNALYLLILVFVLVLAASFWRKGIIIEQIKKLVSVSLIQSAVAQDFDSEKKNTGMRPNK